MELETQNGFPALFVLEACKTSFVCFHRLAAGLFFLEVALAKERKAFPGKRKTVMKTFLVRGGYIEQLSTF
ncbi:MAG: hypothetical protein ACK5M7_10850 [Draconibacterium sp.]